MSRRLTTDATIGAPLSVPTMFAATAVDAEADPFVLAVDAARDGGEPGTLLWSPRPDHADCAIILGPEMPLNEALRVSYVAMVAIGDALGALMLPGIPLVFGWPDRIVVNGITAGGIRLAWPEATAPDATPAWMAVGVQVWVAPDVRAAADLPDATNLLAEGCAEISAREIVEGFSRHFLYWVDRWLDEGFAPVKTAWLWRAANYGPNENMELRRPWADRKLLWLEDTGDIRYAEGGDERKVCLLDAVRRPSWLARP